MFSISWKKNPGYYVKTNKYKDIFISFINNV